MKDLSAALLLTFHKQFSILCYNVNGISSIEKRTKIFNRFIYPYKNNSPEIVCFQELKLQYDSAKNFVSKMTSYSNFLSIEPAQLRSQISPKRGVSISLHKSVQATILDKKVEPGWLLMLKIRMQEKVFVIVNAYLPATQVGDLYRSHLEIIDKHLKSLKCDNIIFMGDFNTTLSDMDCNNTWTKSHKISSKQLNAFIDKWEMQDAWRLQNPFTKQFTHRQVGSNNYQPRRLDYVFMSLNLSPYVYDTKIGVSYCSDHSPLIVELRFNEEGGKRPFIFPVDLCHSEEFRGLLKNNLSQVKKENKDANPHTLWDIMKSTVRTTALRFKSLQKKIRKELVEELEAKIAKDTIQMDLEPSLLMKANYSEKIQQHNKELDNLFQEGKALKYARNLAKWYGESSKPTAYFLNKFKVDKGKPIISTLITDKGTVTTNAQILKEAHRFYSNLYQKKEIKLPSNDRDQVRTLVPAFQQAMSQEISINEMYSALKSMRTVSSPGNDGLTVKFYLHFWDLINEDLVNCFEYSYDEGKLSNSQRIGIIKLLPKKQKNLLLIENWRPITLLNVDYKIVAKLFAVRLKDILPDVIHPDQRGFIKNRRINDCILDVYAVADIILNSNEDLDFLMCAINIRKAFDSIDWDFLWFVLNLYDFPPEFIKWFDVFYSDRIAYVSNNNQNSDPIKIEKGNFQGCPLSPLFFAMAIEILANRIRENQNIQGVKFQDLEKKINLVADDILLVFRNSFRNCKNVEQELKEFSANSGLTVNYDKCTISRVNHNMTPPNQDTLPLFKRKQLNFDYIGMNIPFNLKDTWDANIPAKIDKMMTEMGTCSELGTTTVLGRVAAIKSLFFSRFPFFFESVVIPKEQVLISLQTKLNNIVWNGKKPKMKLVNAVMPVKKGGLGMIDVIHRYYAIKIQLLERALNTENVEFWQAHLYSLFSIPIDTLVASNIPPKSIKKFTVRPLPGFWQEVFDIWTKCHFVSNNTKASQEEIREFLSRPIAYNGAFGTNLLSKRYTPELKDYLDAHRWFSISDALTLTSNVFPPKGYISRTVASNVIKSIPLHWKQAHNDQKEYTIAQKIIDQKLSQGEIYQCLIQKHVDLKSICVKWESDGIQVDWETLTPKVKCQTVL